MPSASDVPDRFDLVLTYGGNSYGFVLDDALESSYPFRVHRATYSKSPLFVERSNVSGNYGDNQQDFWLTASQNDWSLGEQQRYFRQGDGDSVRRYWTSDGADVSQPGQIGMRPGVTTSAPGTLVAATSGRPSSSGGDVAHTATATNLKTIDQTGVVTDAGAHGLGAAPSLFGLATDPVSVYLSTTSAGTVGVRRWNGTAFSTFSASPADSLCFLNNTLYGFRETNGDLVKYDTAGTLTSIYTWKDATGTAITGSVARTRLRAFGGKLLILRRANASDRYGELWLYDGTAPTKIAELSPNFNAQDFDIVAGTVFISGYYVEQPTGTVLVRPAVLYWANGSLDELWRSSSVLLSATGYQGIGRLWSGLVFNDPTANKLMLYNPKTGGISTLATHTTPAGATSTQIIGLNSNAFVTFIGTANSFVYPSPAWATTTTITSALFDFDSSLTKYFRGVTVEFDSGADGNGGSVDVSYRLNDVNSTYTSLATGVTSGAEVTFPTTVTGRSISIQVRLNQGLSTYGPVLKRIKVRAAPVMPQFRLRKYVLNCAADAQKGAVTLRDGLPSPKTGREMVDDLLSAQSQTVPITVTDRFGTYTCVVDDLSIFEVHPGIESPSTKTGEFVAELQVREV